MRVMREGVRAWCVEEVCGSPFFLEMEYQMIRKNHPRSLLVMQLKEEDGKKMLFYEISGKKSLSGEAKQRGLTGKDCIRIMEGLLHLQNDLDAHMLKIDQVLFVSDYIFFGQEGVSFIYLPEKQEDIPAKIESFFSWILSAIDYDDTDAVRFMYQVFWRIRSRGYSGDLLIQCLAHVKGPEEAGPGEDREEPRSPAAGETGRKREVLSSYEKREKTAGDLPIRWLMLIPAVLTGGAGILFFLLGIQYGYTMKLKGLILACFCLSAASAAFLLGGMKRKEKKDPARPDGRQKEEEDEEKRQLFPTSFARWEDEPDNDKTEVLSLVPEEEHPYLRNKETGEIHIIKEFPFHIGSEEALNQLVPGTRSVSREHAVIYGGSSGFFIQDLRSTNGTWLNGEKLNPDMPALLLDGARLRFAGVEYSYHRQGRTKTVAL